MSNHTHLLADVRKAARAARQAQPFDSMSKAELWQQLQAATNAANGASIAAQSAATMAHNFAQGSTGEQRRQLLEVRDAAYKARDAANAF